jgi:hypothetical protein
MEQIKKIEFACFFERLQKKLDIRINSDIVSKIYDIYDGTYENYTLLELISILLENNIRITCPWNKKIIIEMIISQDNKTYIQKKYEPMKPSKCTLKKSQEYSLQFNDFITISNHDIIKFSNGNEYEIMIIKEEQNDNDDCKIYVFLFNLNINQEICYYPKTLASILDYEDITIITNKDKNLFDGPYENYTLIELLHIIKEKKIDITCPWNKKMIIEMIKTDEQKFNIPKKYEPLIPSTWNFDKHKITTDSYRDEYLSMSSKLYNASFEFKYNDLIRLIDGNIYIIEFVRDTEFLNVNMYVDIMYVYMYCNDTGEEKYVYGDEFVKMLDYEDVTIIRNRSAKYNLY